MSLVHLTYLIILGISFLISLTVYWRENEQKYLKFFPPFLLLTLMVETAGKIMARYVHNGPLYYIFLPSEFIFYFFILTYIIQSTQWKKVIKNSCWIYALIIAFVTSIEGFRGFPTLLYCTGSILLLVFCSIYFYELFEMPISPNLAREPNFWIVCSLFIFYGASLPLWAANNLMNGFSENALYLMSIVLFSLNYILYSLFAVAFLCDIKFRKPTS